MVKIMPKGKGKVRRGTGETKAERAVRRAIVRELPAIKAVAECCDGFRDEWRALGGADHAEDAVAEWPRVIVSRDGVVDGESAPSAVSRPTPPTAHSLHATVASATTAGRPAR